MFESLDICQKEMVYIGLKNLVENNTGTGFHNSDQGHPFYRAGAEGNPDAFDDGDNGDSNRLFMMLSELSKEFKAADHIGYQWWTDFSEWQDFCKFAVQAYDEQRP